MSAITSGEMVGIQNQAARRNEQSALRTMGMNSFQRQVRSEANDKQTHTRLSSMKMREMYAMASAVGTQKAKYASKGVAPGSAQEDASVTNLRTVQGFQSEVQGQELAMGIFAQDLGFANEVMRENEKLTNSLNQAQSMKRSKSNALIAGIFQDTLSVVGMGTGIAGAVGSFRS
tara:strand:+ start:8476 stop:8997 length:522 start_codon:yes stop_codon:yes gene_type:complete